MLTIILLESGATSAETPAAIAAINSAAGNGEIRTANLNASAAEALASAPAIGRILLLNAAAAGAAAQRLIAAAAGSGKLQCATARNGADMIDLPEIQSETAVNAIARREAWPLAAVAADARLIKEQLAEGGTLRELLVRTMMHAALEGIELEILDENIPIEADLCTLRNNECARLLSYVVNLCNVEDLFPNHAWAEHGEESAAACYHTLAAHFIRFADLDSAKECLAFSDRLEDSPRSLALKAIISMTKGETLGAVANLISSLQQYETRKRNKDTTHYLSFSPDNLEAVNQRLQQGLTALNKQDNRSALEHFAAAVFNFDSFYVDNGLDGLIIQ